MYVSGDAARDFWEGGSKDSPEAHGFALPSAILSGVRTQEVGQLEHQKRCWAIERRWARRPNTEHEEDGTHRQDPSLTMRASGGLPA